MRARARIMRARARFNFKGQNTEVWSSRNHANRLMFFQPLISSVFWAELGDKIQYILVPREQVNDKII